MHTHLSAIGILGMIILGSNAAAAQAEPCSQIRAQIQAQTELLPKPNTDLLRKLSANAECRFTAVEVYRAAYGNKPLPRNERKDRHSKHHRDDD